MSALEELIERVNGLPAAAQAKLKADAAAATRDCVWVPNVGPQTDAYFSLADELFYGGQAGGGKTDLLLGLGLTAHRRALILRRINKDAVKLVNRVESVVGHRNGFNGQQQSWRFPDARRLDFGGCELEIDKQRYKGEPHDLIGFDEGSDFLYSQFRFIITWLRSADPEQRCRVVVASNPPLTAQGLWVIKHWAPWLDKNHPRPARPAELRWFLSGESDDDIEVDGPGPHLVRGRQIRARSRTYIPSSVEDNPDYARGDYVSVLESLPAELRRAYRDGDFTVGQSDDDYQVIPTGWIEAAMQRWSPDCPKGMRMTALAVDVAPGGGDERVIAYRYGGWFAPLQAKREVDKSGRLTASEVVKYRRDRCPVIVDLGGGWGGDALIALKDNIDGTELRAFNGVAASSGRTRDGKLRFRNKRAEATWKLREALDPEQEGGSVVALPPDPELKADLASYRWELTTGGILIEDKTKIRERLGRSPDKGDAVVMCVSEGEAAERRLMAQSRGQRPVYANRGHAHLKR